MSKQIYLYIMKKLLLALFLVSTQSFAEIPSTVSVYVSQLGGTQDVVCRKMFELYEKTYKSNAVIVNKPGGFGVIAAREVVGSSKFAAGCGTTSEHVFNHFLYPESSADLSKIRIVTQIVNQPEFYYTGPKNSADTLQELIVNAQKENRSLNIGMWPGSKVRIEVILRQYNVKYNWIPFQRLADMLPVLADGSLDLGIEGGNFVPVAQERKIKLLGYASRADMPELLYPNVAKQFPVVNSVLGSFTVYMAKSTPDHIVEEFSNRLATVINSEEFLAFCRSRNITPVGNTALQAQANMDKLWQAVAQQVSKQQ